MIAAWMLFALETALLLAGAAWLAERALLALRRPVRSVWMLAMLGTVLLPLAAWFAPAPHATNASVSDGLAGAPVSSLSSSQPGQGSAPNASSSIITPRSNTASTTSTADSVPATTSPSETRTVDANTSLLSRIANAPFALHFNVAATSPLQALNAPLLVLWAVLLTLGALLSTVAIWRTWRERARWTGEYVDGTPVLVSHDVGPALVGVLHYSIVVPRWVFELEERARTLVVAHEREHARSYDPLLLASGVLLVVLAPWNAVNWWLLKRLRLAIELDCDKRVLRAYPDSRHYGALLLDIAERVLPSPMPTAALVEHGTSLERRIQSMISPRAKHHLVRVGGNALAVGALVAVACVAPRPYASVPPAQRATLLASDLANVLASDSLARAVPSSERMAILQRVADAVQMQGNANGLQVGNGSAEPMIEGREERRLREAVMKAAPATLSRWPRNDSALVVLFNADGSVAKQSVISTAQMSYDKSAFWILMSVYWPTAAASFAETDAIAINRDGSGKLLSVPLQLFWARLRPGAPVPRTRHETLPSHEQMVAILRTKHPEIFGDTTQNPLIGTLLYDMKGTLLGTAAVRVTEPRTWPDGQENREFDHKVFRQAFGSLLDSAAIFQNGTTFYLDEGRQPVNAPRLMYAVIARESELSPDPLAMVRQLHPGDVTGATSSRAPERPMDGRERDRRLMGLTVSHRPEAFSTWSRADSSVLILLDADDQLITLVSGSIAENARLLYLVDMITDRVRGVRPDDIVTVGSSRFARDPGGRSLNTPLNIVWGKLKRGAPLPPRRN